MDHFLVVFNQYLWMLLLRSNHIELWCAKLAGYSQFVSIAWSVFLESSDYCTVIKLHILQNSFVCFHVMAHFELIKYKSQIRLPCTLIYAAFKLHSGAMHKVSAHQLTWYYQLQWVPSMACTVSVTWYVGWISSCIAGVISSLLFLVKWEQTCLCHIEQSEARASHVFGSMSQCLRETLEHFFWTW